jgi:hypothetical protein
VKPRIQQLHRSGALDGEVPVWDEDLGHWVPGNAATERCRATLVASGGETDIELGVTPITTSELVFVNGALLTWGVDYTITGSVITLTDPLTGSDRVSVTYGTAGACGTASLVTPPFDPTTITGMVLWLAADDLSLTDGDPIGTWADQSTAGNDATQSSGIVRPTFKTNQVNGLPVARFDGNDKLDSALSMSSAACTMLAVLKPTGTGYRTILAANLAAGLQWRIDDTTNYQTLNSEYTTAVATSTNAVTSAFHVIAATFDDGTSYAFKFDGSASGSGSHSVTLTAGRTAVIGSAPGTFGGEWFTGDIAELLVYDSVLSSGDLNDLTNYLQAKYAL